MSTISKKLTSVSRHVRRSRAPFALVAAALALGAAMPLAAAKPRPPVESQAARSIDEGMFVSINGVEQWVTVRGSDRRNPVLLILHGGPGLGLSNAAPLFAGWEAHYTIVQWDQPGTGATYARNIGRDVGPLTVERYTRDGIAVADFARKHLGTRRVALLGFSWGTLLGVEMVQRRPDLFSAYIGSAQVVSGPKGTLLGYQLAIAAARKRGDTAAVKALETAGPPPYASLAPYMVRQQYAVAPTAEEAPRLQAFMQAALSPPPADAHYVAHGLPAYDVMKVFVETWGALSQAQLDWDAEKLGLKFRMPVYIFQGAEDINTPATMAMDWCARISAPAKACATIPGAGHSTIVFPNEILALLDQHVRPGLVKRGG